MFDIACRVRGAGRRVSSLRGLVLIGTALGGSLALPANAEKVIFNGTGDFAVTRADTLTDTAQVVDARTTTGNLSLNLATVNVSNNSGNQGSGIYGQVTGGGAGNIAITSGTLTASGNTAIYGIDARAGTGNVTINAGTTTANNNANSRGIYALTNGGNITINATQTDGGQRGIFTGGSTGFPNVTTITSGTATANGLTQPNAIVGQGQTVNITSGTASLTAATGNSGAAIFSNSDTSFIKSTTVNTAGLNQSGIQINADLGISTIDSGTVNAAQSTTAIKGDITAFSGTSNTAGATIKSQTINLNGANSQGFNWNSASTGVTSIDSGTIIAKGTNSVGIQGNVAGNAVIKSGTITLQGTNSTGISWTATGAASTDIDSGTISGGNLVVTPATGATTIKSDTITNGRIDVEGGTGAINITSNKVQGTGLGLAAITANTASGPAAITIASTAITGSGGGIDVFGNGAVNVTSGSIAQTVTASGVNSLNAQGISAVAQGAAAMTINSGSIAFTGTGNTTGIAAQAVGGGALNINSGSVSVIGNGGYGILGSATSGTITIASTGDIATLGTTRAAGGSTAANAQRYADGIDAISLSGAINVSSAGTISTAGAAARGIDAEAGRAITTFGTATTAASTAAISVANTGTVTTKGANATGINVQADNNAVTLASANVTTSGANAVGINIASNAGAINATTGNVTTTGATSDAVHIVSASGPITVNVNGALSAANGTGLFIDPPSAVVVNVAAAGSARGSTNGISTVGATNTITNLGTISNSGTGVAILASGATTLDNSGTITAGSGGTAVQLGATNDAVTLRTGSSVTGAIAGGGGTDSATLAGTTGTATATQTIARFTGFNSLNVASGYWTAAPATGSAFNTATVAAGASLELANAGAGLGITTPSLVDNGTLVVRSTAAGTGSTFGTTAVTGTGTILLTGTGTVTLNGTNSLANTGAVTVDNGVTALVTGTQGGSFITNAGGTLQIGNGGTVGSFTGSLADNGTLVVSRSDDYTFAGALTGAGTIVKSGAGKLTFGTNYAFTGVTNILAGSVKLSTPVAANTELDVEGAGQLDLSGTQQTVAELAGASTAASVNIAGGSLTVNQATNTTFAGNLTGAGSFTKSGTGLLNFTGADTYTGPTTINGGTLAVNGSIVSAVTVNSGARLGGTGSVGGAAITAGGTYAPGNSIGTQTVNGNVSFAAGSTYEVEANADGRSDRIIATGTATLAGGTVSVLAEAGTFGKVTTYNILTATGGVTGRFTNVTSNFAFLSPLLSYTATGVDLTLARNDISFGAIATSPNQLAVANAVAARGLGNAVFNAVLMQSTAGGQAAFDALGGEIFSTVPTVLVDEGRRVRGAVLDRASAGGDGAGVWATGLLNRAESNGGAGVAASTTDRKGVISGVDFGRDGWRLGAAAGYIDSDVDVGARASHADVTSKLVSVYGGWTGGRLTAQAGGSYTWHDVDTTRTIAVTGLAGTQTASFNANSAQGFAELSYKLTDGPFVMAPFIGYAHVRTHTDGVTEGGTAAALAVASNTRDTDFASAGLKIWGSAPISTTAMLLPKISISYQRAWGDLDGATSATFGGTGTAFGVTGARLGKSTLDVDGGFDIAVGAFRIGAGAYASTSSQWSDYGAKASVGFTF